MFFITQSASNLTSNVHIFELFQNWGLCALCVILNPHILVLVLPWKNFPDNGQRLFLGHFASGEIHLELLHQNLYVLLSELVALGCFIQANIKHKLTWNTKRMVRIRWLKTKTFYEDKIETNLRQMKLKQTRIKLKQSKIEGDQFAGGHQLLRSFLLLSTLLGGSTSSLFRIVKVLFDQDRLNKVPEHLNHSNESVSKVNELTSSGPESRPLYFSLCFWLFVPCLLFSVRK